MANEAAIVELLGNQGNPVRYTVADGTGIAKGTALYLSAHPRTVAAHSAQGQIFVGFAASEKVASDGDTTLSAYTYGIFDVKDQGAGMTLGDICKLGSIPNTVATADEAGANAPQEVVGLVLETATGSDTVMVKVNK